MVALTTGVIGGVIGGFVYSLVAPAWGRFLDEVVLPQLKDWIPRTGELVVRDPGEQKIKVIGTIRTYTKLGLRESKEVCEGTPWPYTHGEARALKEALEDLGAVVEVRRS